MGFELFLPNNQMIQDVEDANIHLLIQLLDPIPFFHVVYHVHDDNLDKNKKKKKNQSMRSRNEVRGNETGGNQGVVLLGKD